MNDRVPSLQRFLESLERHLRQMPAEDIRGSLLLHAQGLPGSDRDAFLAIFTATGPTGDGVRAGHAEAPDITWPVDHDPLLVEIDDFVDRVASGGYFEGFGWDDEVHDQRSFGDESWVWEFDDLFSGAQEAFLAGELGLARAAYQRLLDAFALDEEVGTFCGPEPALDMVGTDISEVQARYLRAVYETTPAAERAAALVEVWFDLPDPRADVSLAAVCESRRQDLPNLEGFLPAWIAELRSSGRESPQVRRLLTEATDMYGGIDGLADLARQGGRDQPDLYLEWVRALHRAERYADAVNAALEALGAIEGDGSIRADIAEELADLSRGDAGQVAAARRTAWRASPNQSRLLALHWAGTHTGEATDVMATEVATLDASENFGRLDGGLRAALMLLAGRVDDAAELLGRPADHGTRRQARDVLLPYLLASGCAGPRHPEWPSTQLAGLLATVDNVHTWAWWSDFHRPDQQRSGDVDMPSLATLLTEQISTEVGDERVLSKRLDAAVQEIDRQVDAIVSRTSRGQYARAARLLACCAEALTLADGADAGPAVVGKWNARYPRHSAFQSELRVAIQKSRLTTAIRKGTAP